MWGIFIILSDIDHLCNLQLFIFNEIDMSEFSNLIGSASFGNGQEVNSPTDGEGGGSELKLKPGSRRSRASKGSTRKRNDGTSSFVITFTRSSYLQNYIPCV